MGSWFHTMLTCGLLIASLQASNGSRIPGSRNDKRMLRTNIQQLQEHYNTNSPDWVGRSLFTRYLDKMNSSSSCTYRSMILEGMLNIYEEIFTDMLNKSEKKELKNSVKEVLSEVKTMRHNYSQEHRLWRDLQEIHLIKVKNSTIQGTVLNEFLMVFNKAYAEKHH